MNRVFGGFIEERVNRAAFAKRHLLLSISLFGNSNKQDLDFYLITIIFKTHIAGDLLDIIII